jgi:Flp pilus assembly protein CpaB
MKGRGLVVVLALILATLATAGVFLYARGVQEEAKTGGTLEPVVVSKVDIPANSDLNALIKDDQFKIIQVPKTTLVGGAVTSIDQLRDKNNSVAILAGEQIPVARISGEGTVPGGALGIPPGYEAMTVSVDSPRAVAGAVTKGDHVTLYGTFEGFTTPGGKKIPSMTTVVVPSALVLAVYQPSYVNNNGGLGSQSTQQGTGTVAMTIALTPVDSEKTVFTMETGRVWLGLLPPKANGTSLPRVTLGQVVK